MQHIQAQENWTINPLYKPKETSPKVPDIPEQVLIKAEARFPKLKVNLTEIDIPDLIYYEPYVLRFDRK